MLGFFKRLREKRYQRQKIAAQTGDVRQRLNLAGSNRTRQEILYYLAAHDPDPQVRRAVAKNRSTPVQASAVLAADIDIDVRLALADRLVRLLPHLAQPEHSQLYAFAVQALGMLALDEVLKIRKALSSTLKDYAAAPPKVVGQLARDVEREVSEPILRFCVALADEDLLDILSNHPAPWAVQAIAGRDTVSARVSQAVIDVDDMPAGVLLLENKGAKIGMSLLEIIIDRARNYPEWQKPVALRGGLPPEMAKKLAEFADASVRDVLMRRSGFDKETVDGIAAVFRRRLSYAGGKDAEDTEPPAARAVRLAKEGKLTEESIADALAMRDKAFVFAALARLAATGVPVVEKIFELKAPRPIVALCWKADLSMRMALQLQKEVGQVPPRELIYPRGGTDYPLTRDELVWQLEFLGLKAA